ncbi:MAG: TetR/AcrR family transcriptional regulator [Xanthomonadales bacterium]|nr:TetR/AcrR family transcriptional regulator [Gammaproteobacteria bacterium]MBT8072641.1 TetR/AcrR family transcriptional regulator [Gammaproteobacteria bacterium]NNK03482.1 TetR/AcrR family transcriptional regulator [Xanthomonadales bacterium]NNK99319.1 TetR/AcrR family transcriptional regulator [Xanthomonadales bacterium]
MAVVKKLTERKHDDIIQAAKDEFRANGFVATSMDRIAKTAQVSKRTVYNHFESKEVLFSAIAQDLCNTFSQVSEYPYDTDKPVREQLEAIAEQQINMLCSERFLRLFKMTMSETLTSPSLTRSVIEDFQKENIGVVKWITAAGKAGKLRIKDPVAAGKQFLALLESFTSWPYLFGEPIITDKKEQRSIIDSAVSMFLDHYEDRS